MGRDFHTKINERVMKGVIRWTRLLNVKNDIS
jgi:hypothetical protein